jgi:hypothetical protein
MTFSVPSGKVKENFLRLDQREEIGRVGLEPTKSFDYLIPITLYSSVFADKGFYKGYLSSAFTNFRHLPKI